MTTQGLVLDNTSENTQAVVCVSLLASPSRLHVLAHLFWYRWQNTANHPERRTKTLKAELDTAGSASLGGKVGLRGSPTQLLILTPTLFAAPSYGCLGKLSSWKWSRFTHKCIPVASHVYFLMQTHLRDPVHRLPPKQLGCNPAGEMTRWLKGPGMAPRWPPEEE